MESGQHAAGKPKLVGFHREDITAANRVSHERMI